MTSPTSHDRVGPIDPSTIGSSKPEFKKSRNSRGGLGNVPDTRSCSNDQSADATGAKKSSNTKASSSFIQSFCKTLGDKLTKIFTDIVGFFKKMWANCCGKKELE